MQARAACAPRAWPRAYGARVMVAEEYRVGGTCVIRGCVPKKLLVYASRFAEEFEDAAGYGWTVPEPTFHWPTLIANKDREIARLEAAYTQHARALQGRAGQKPRGARRRPHRPPPGDRQHGARGDDPDRDRRLAALRAEDSRSRTRHLLERGVSSRRIAQAHRDPGRRLYRGGVRLHFRTASAAR